VSNASKSTEKNGAVAWMAGHSVAANLIMLLFLVGGFLSLGRIKQELFPEFTVDIVSVSVIYPGASPEEVEKGIVLSVEEAIAGLDFVDRVRSTAGEGRGTVSIELVDGTDIDKATQDVKSEVDRITTFPVEAEEPVVVSPVRRREVLSLILYGDLEKTVLHEIAEEARDQLMQNPGITQVDIMGLPPLEISIELSQETLRRYGLTVSDVASRLAASSLDIPGGGIKTGTGELLVRVKERRDYGKQFATIPIITTPDGGQVLLGQIARITDSFEDSDREMLYNGHAAITLEVFRVGNQTPIGVGDAVREELESVRADLPPGTLAAIHHDRSEMYRDRLDLLVRNGMLGLGLVLVFLGLFLEARLAFWVMMGIPISFLGSFLFLPTMDLSINMMSMFAYIIALGIVVDDAVVVGENIHRYRQAGMPPLDAAIKAAREVATPVTFSILTNIVAFIPLYLIPGTMGKIFSTIPLVVILVFVISLVESLFVLPAHLGHQRDRIRSGFTGWFYERQQAFGRAFTRWVNNRYGRFLYMIMRHRYATVAVATSVLLVAISYALSGRMGMQLFPIIESDFAYASITLPYGTPVEKTKAAAKKLLVGARKVAADVSHPELITEIKTDIGSGGGHRATMHVSLGTADMRDDIMSTADFTVQWRKNVGEISGVESMVFKGDEGGPGGRGRPITVELSHRDMDVLEKASTELASIIESYPIAKDVDDGFQPGKQQLDFSMKPEGLSLGLTAREIASQMRNAFYGAQVTRQQRGRSELKIMVRLSEKERSLEHSIESFLVRTPAGKYVPLREVADVKRGRAYTSIGRNNGRRVVDVSADASPRGKSGEVLDDLKITVLPVLLAKYSGLTYSFEGHQADMSDSLGSLKTTFVLALMAIFALLAIPFRSYVQPFIVMTSIPFGIVGALLGHLIMGFGLSIPSLLGIIALAGVLVNDSLVLIDFANRLHKEEGQEPWDAIHNAALQRFRPIILTTLTTFGGLAPMIFETSRAARFLIPMALSLGYGILFATAITLVLVPSLYLIANDAEERFGRSHAPETPSAIGEVTAP
jgi:multidrug efflux pump subunit AcrB